MELADLVVINKADLDAAAATRAQAQITSAHAAASVMQLSALEAEGIERFWATVLAAKAEREASGEFAARRKQQALDWMWDIVHARLQADFDQHPAVRAALPDTLRSVSDSRVAPSAAARALLDLFEKN